MSAKRIFDIFVACFGLMLFSPIMIIVALIIKITSCGPIFFCQDRVGRKEIIFRIYKFRTMVNKASEMGSSITTQNDNRITVIGRVLRKTKLDELPQLINVLKGDMSFVGPRPDVPEIVKNYTPEMKRIFEIKPGITSVATLYFRDEEKILSYVDSPDNFYEKILVPLKVQLAMTHVDNNSFLFYFSTFCQTVWMLSPVGKIFPIKGHRIVSDLKKEIYNAIRGKEE